MIGNMQKGLYIRLTNLLIFFLLLAVSTAAFPQCSTAAWSNVVGSPLALGPATSPMGMKYEQSCGLTVDATAVPAYVTTDTPTNETQVSARFYVLADALTINSGDVTLLRGRDGATTQFEVRLRDVGGVKFLVAFYRDNGFLVQHGETFEFEEVWHAVQVGWSAGSGDGTFSLKLDGITQFAHGDLVNGSEAINQVDLGIVNNASTDGEAAFDAFMLRRTGDPGLLVVNELRNISTRAEVQTGDEIVIGGFIINGETLKCVVVRGRGPSINAPVVKLSDPTLILKQGTTTIASNNNWGTSPDADLMSDLGLAPPNASEAAIYTCIGPGAYTALLSGVGGTTGVGIVEVFDADVGTPYLRNISTRSFVGAGDLRAIGGFVINGSEPKQVLIRGRGPSINAPVTKISNPFLQLFDSEGLLVDQNNNWQDEPNSTDIDATGLAPGNNLEAAILITLEPGNYTAIVSGFNGQTTGVGIVEVFDQSGGSIVAQ